MKAYRELGGTAWSTSRSRN